MTPYRNVRYWLGDFRHNRPQSDREKFNHAHAKLRNVIERSFGVLKARFPILKKMAPFTLVTQRNITIACFAIHNFIRKEGLRDELFSHYDQPEMVVNNEDGDEDTTDEDDDNNVDIESGASDPLYMVNLRDEIANQL